MSFRIIPKGKNIRIIQDIENPETVYLEFRCWECKEWIHEDKVVWFDLYLGIPTENYGTTVHLECVE